MSRTHTTTGAAAAIAERWRLVELCLPCQRGCGQATFRPAGEETFDADWDAWLGRVFVPLLQPTMVALQACVAAQSFTALLGADAGLGAALGAPESAGSLSAGRHALLSCAPPRGAKILERLRAAAAANSSAGHLATVFAVRGQVFHLPSVQLSGALLLAECILGATGAGLLLPADRVADFMARAAVNAAPPPQLMAV